MAGQRKVEKRAGSGWWVMRVCLLPTSYPPLILLLILLLGLAWAQPSDPARGDLRIVILGDINGSFGATEYAPGVHQAVRHTATLWRPDLVLLPGDLVAGQSHRLPLERFAQMWAAFERDIASPLRAAGIFYAPTIGNHDGSSLRRTDGTFAFARERQAAARYWQQHPPPLAFHDRDDFPFHYTFSLGPLFVLVWDGSSATLLPDTLVWAEQALQSDAAQRADLRLVMGHLPLYGVAEGRDRPGEILAEGERLRQWLEARHVDIYLSGHHHAYYPARLGDLLLIHAGAAVSPRRLLGENTARPTVTVLDIDLAPLSLRLTTFDLRDWPEIALTDLPPFLDTSTGRLWRIDRSPASPCVSLSNSSCTPMMPISLSAPASRAAPLSPSMEDCKLLPASHRSALWRQCREELYLF